MFLNKNIILLLLGQGFSGAVVSLLTFSSGLAGKWLLDSILYAKACLLVIIAVLPRFLSLLRFVEHL